MKVKQFDCLFFLHIVAVVSISMSTHTHRHARAHTRWADSCLWGVLSWRQRSTSWKSIRVHQIRWHFLPLLAAVRWSLLISVALFYLVASRFPTVIRPLFFLWEPDHHREKDNEPCVPLVFARCWVHHDGSKQSWWISSEFIFFLARPVVLKQIRYLPPFLNKTLYSFWKSPGIIQMSHL